MKTNENEVGGMLRDSSRLSDQHHSKANFREWWEYEWQPVKRALSEIRASFFFRGATLAMITAVLTYFGLIGVGVSERHETAVRCIVSVCAGLVAFILVFGVEFLFKLIRASVRMNKEQKMKMQEKETVIQKQAAQIKTLENEIERRNKVGRQEFRSVVEQEIYNLKRSNPTPQDFLINRIPILQPAIDHVKPFVRGWAGLEILWLEFNALDKRTRIDFNMDFADFSVQIDQLENKDEDWAKIKTCLEGFLNHTN